MTTVKQHIEQTMPTTIQQIFAAQGIKEKQQIIVNSLINQVPHVNPFLYGTDSYKVSHIRFETAGVKEIYSNFTPRFAKYLKTLLGDAFDGRYVVFGIQWLLLRLHVMAKTGFFDRQKDVVIAEMRRVLSKYIGQEDFKHFEALHDLGYLPVIIKTLDEGTTPNVGVPFLTIRNTLPEFEWLPNFLETLISTELWKQLTVATVARAFKRVSIEAALKTTGSIAGIEWQNHDFHVRGASGFESAAIVGAAFLTSSCGTDNMASLWATENFYFSSNDEDLLAGSVSAGEHSVTTSGILTEQERAKAELLSEEKGITLEEAVQETILDKVESLGITLTDAERRYAKSVLTEKFPTGIVAYVADSFDYWAFVSEIVPSLKTEILARDGKFVVRGDSGNPVDVITGTKGVDIKDAVARKFISESEVGKTFTVQDTVYLTLAKPSIPETSYIPLFELVRNNFVRVYDKEAEILAVEEARTELISEIHEKINARTVVLANYLDEDELENITCNDEDELTPTIEEALNPNDFDEDTMRDFDVIILKELTTSLTELEAKLETLVYDEPGHVVIAAEEKGTIEVLWEIFGGTITDKGYKLLDSHIGMIYGDGITVQRSQEIFARLEAKGFASLNIVYGVGSYSLNMLSRDHLGMAIKATNTIVDIHGTDVDKPIYKDPKTDTSKKSARGLIRVFKDETGEIVFEDMQTREQEDTGLLTVAYKDGQFEKFTTIFEIRDRMWSYLNK